MKSASSSLKSFLARRGTLVCALQDEVGPAIEW
jgi:hypothetical protein